MARYENHDEIDVRHYPKGNKIKPAASKIVKRSRRSWAERNETESGYAPK